MDKVETDLIENIAKTVSEAVIKSQSHSQVSNTVENPLTWIGFLGLLFILIGSLIVFIYNSNQNSQNVNIIANKEAISEIQKTTQTMQADQERITTVVTSINKVVDKIIDKQNAIVSSRFQDKDFPIYIRPYSDRLANLEGQVQRSIKTLDEVDSMKLTLARIEADLRVLTAQVAKK